MAQSTEAAVNRGEKPKAVGTFTILKETGADWMQDNAMRLSAALSLYTILSLAPLLVISLKIIGVIWRNKESAQTNFMKQITSLMGSDGASVVKGLLNNGGRHGQGVLAAVISLLVLLFSATGVFAELQDSMNTIWGVKPKPNQGIWVFIRNRLLSMAMVLGIAFLLLVSMFVSTLMSAMAHYFAGDTKWIAIPLDIVVSFGVVSVLFAAIFKFLPDVKIAWGEVWAGAVLTAALFIVGKYGLALYFKYGTPTSAFGAAGSLVAVLLWVYYSAFILFFGAEFTKVWSVHLCGRIIPSEDAVKVTEEDRAQQGVPTQKRMRQAMQRSLPSSKKTNDRAPQRSYTRPASQRVAPAYALTAIAGLAAGYGTRCLLEKRDGAGVRSATAQLTARVSDIQAKLGRASRIGPCSGREIVDDGMLEIQRTIRNTADAIRYRKARRLRWLKHILGNA
ncbi:MAG TPA: YihY/virulence factor BrkB family protein [Tepidisphaeraceae bacterium]|jgi:membrane protein|nr:YihY/virulence factor BrkB family protein [Tepidisphaeraceae bacterium]